MLAESVENTHHLGVRAATIVAGVGGDVVHGKRTSIGGGQIRYKVHAAIYAFHCPNSKLLKTNVIVSEESGI